MAVIDIGSDYDEGPKVIEQEARVSKPPKMKKLAKFVIILVLVIAVVLIGIYAWKQHNDNTKLNTQLTSIKNNPQQAIQQQTTDLINKVGTLINLPKGETPTVASVTDPTQAKKQSAFFNDAQVGDKVLLYVKAGEAILYRPSTNKIILVAPLTFNNSTKPTTTTTTTTTP